MKAALEFRGLEKYILDTPNTDTNTVNLRKAKSRLVVAVLENVHIHIENEHAALGA